MKHEIKLIALDLDGTLLNSEKKLSARNYAALERAAALGIQIVPCTGRLLCALPEAVRGLPFLHYAICVNGAQVVDAETGRTLCRADIPHERGMEVFRTLSALPGVYDCYMDGHGWMDAAMYDPPAGGIRRVAAVAGVSAQHPHAGAGFSGLYGREKARLPENTDLLPHPGGAYAL